MSIHSASSPGKLTLRYFYADWCEPCKWAQPVIEEVIGHFDGKINLQKIDIEEQPEIARTSHVLSVPVLLLTRNGDEVWRMNGFDLASNLIAEFKNYL